MVNDNEHTASLHQIEYMGNHPKIAWFKGCDFCNFI